MDPFGTAPDPHLPDPYLPPSRHPRPPEFGGYPAAGYTGPLAGGPAWTSAVATPPAPAAPPWYRRFIAGAVVIALLAGVAALLFREQLFPAKVYPDHWDSRVTDLVTFVEETRGLTFEHPVTVSFLSEADFVRLFDQGPGGGVPADAARAYSQVFNAQGLATAYDVNAGESTVSTVTTLGLYMPDTDKVYVRGNELTAAVRVVLAHELTHALQAQHFTLHLNGPDDLRVRSIVEADAMRVEDAYTATLSAADREAVTAANTLSADGEDQLADVPWAVVEQRYAPYMLGPDLIADVFAVNGNAGIDELLRSPPPEDVLLDPWTLRDPTVDSAVTLILTGGERVIDNPQALSELQLLVMLDAWLPWSQARAALDGWRGGQYATFWKDGDQGTGQATACFIARVRVDTGSPLFQQAIRDWAQAAGSDAVPAVHGDDVQFTACYRGDDASAPAKPLVSPLQALVLEHDAVGLAGSDPTTEEIKGYQCFAATLIDDPIAAPLLWIQEERTDAETAVFRTQEDIASDACGVPRIIPAP